MLKTKQDQPSYLLEATVRIEKGLATLTQNQESLERIIETKFHDLDVKVTEIHTTVEKLQEEVEDRSDRPTTDAFQRVPRAQRSTAVPVVRDSRTTISAPAATASVIPPVSTPPLHRRHLKLLQTDSSPRHLCTPEQLARRPLQELPEIVPRVPHSTMHFQAFW
jgi:hypothetical protein